MGQDQNQVGTPVENEQKTPEQIRQEIREVRQDLGDTAAALAEKTDVKARAREKVDDVKQTVSEKKEALASKVGSNGSGDGTGAGAQVSSAATKVKAKAEANPIPTAAIAAFVAGVLFGRITSRS